MEEGSLDSVSCVTVRVNNQTQLHVPESRWRKGGANEGKQNPLGAVHRRARHKCPSSGRASLFSLWSHSSPAEAHKPIKALTIHCQALPSARPTKRLKTAENWFEVRRLVSGGHLDDFSTASLGRPHIDYEARLVARPRSAAMRMSSPTPSCGPNSARRGGPRRESA